MPDILPQYRFDKRTGQYHSNATGKFVSRKAILNLMEGQINGAEARYTELTTAFYEGRMSQASFIEQMQTEQKRLTLQNSSLGAGGWDQMLPKDFGRVGASLKQDYQRIIGTASDIADGKVTLAQALARVNSYVGIARTQFFLAEKDRVQRSSISMIIIWRRLLAGGGKSCASCVSYYDTGWALEIPMPGESCECGGNCRCRVEHQEIPASELAEWLGTKR